MRANLESTGGLIYSSSRPARAGRDRAVAARTRTRSRRRRRWRPGTPACRSARRCASTRPTRGLELDEARLDEVCRPERYLERLGGRLRPRGGAVVTVARRRWPTGTCTRGKVRDLYDVGDGQVLDGRQRPHLGLRLDPADSRSRTRARSSPRCSLWWFDQLADIVDNHLITADVADYPAELAPYADELRGRSMLCRRLDMVPVECVARGYLAGSGFTDYAATGAVCGIPLPAGLLDGSRLPEPIFTPTTKAAVGEHDENVTYDEVVGRDRRRATPPSCARLTLAVYARGRRASPASGASSSPTPRSSSAGTRTARFVLGDEVLTPDSSRFWPADTWAPGGAQPSYDKQYAPRLAAARVRLGPRLAAAATCPTRSSPRPAPGTSRPTSGSPASPGPDPERRAAAPMARVGWYAVRRGTHPGQARQIGPEQRLLNCHP